MLTLILFAAATALGSLWVREVMRRGIGSSEPVALRTAPDYFIENFNFVRTSLIGQARYSISGAMLTHFPKEDNYEIALPVVKSLSADRPSITMRAQRAFANSDASRVQMVDDVQVDRPESETAPHFHLKSEYLLIFPDDDVVQTDRAVDITQGKAEITGEGMVANHATLNFTLLHKVHAIVQPQH